MCFILYEMLNLNLSQIFKIKTCYTLTQIYMKCLRIRNPSADAAHPQMSPIRLIQGLITV